MVSLCFLGSATYSQCGKRRGCDFLRIVFGLCDPRHPTFSQLPGRTYIPFRNQLPFEFYYIRVHEQKQGWTCKYFEYYLRVWTRSETLFLYTHPFNNLLIAYNDRRLGREGVAAYWCSENIFAYNAYLCDCDVDRYCHNCVQYWHEKDRFSTEHKYYLIMQNGSSHTVFQIRRAHKYTFCSYAQYPS